MRIEICAAGALGVLLVGASSAFGQASVTNGSFETGDFSGWVLTDAIIPFEAAAVLPTGTVTFFDGFVGPNLVLPSDGNFAASHGFDGGGPDAVSIAQDIGIAAVGDVLVFDYRAGWDLITFALPGSMDRTFDVLVEPAGGGAALGVFPQLTAMVGTDTSGGPNSDTGLLSGMVDLSPFAGTSIRINFLWTMPDSFTGPANAQLDNVRVIPTPGAMAVLGLGGLAAARRRR